MNRITHAALVLAIALVPGFALASSHREAPSIANDAAADNTDLYAWVSSDRSKTYLIANYIPLQEPAGGPNFHGFSDDVRYEIHLARGASSLQQRITYRVTFSTAKSPVNYTTAVDPTNLANIIGGHNFFSQLSGNTQTATITKILYDASGDVTSRTDIATGVPVAPPNIGPRTDTVVYQNTGTGGYNQAYADTFIADMGNSADEGRVFLGPRDDGFYVDLGGVFDLANLRGAGAAQDGVSGFNVHSIAFEIPTGKLSSDGNVPAPTAGSGPTAANPDETLAIWATASRRKVTMLRNNGRRRTFGNWVQVSRLGFPLVNEAVIGIQDKDKYNATHPSEDVSLFGAYILNPLVVVDAQAVGIYDGLTEVYTDFDDNRTDILDIVNIKTTERPITSVATTLRLDPSVASGFPNGRGITASSDTEAADVTDVILSVFLTGGATPISDGVDYNDVDFLADFPFLAPPHAGYDGGHGTTTPAP
jgi:hypothetical protein